MGKTFSFWWTCVKGAVRGNSAFANDWQWVLANPLWQGIGGAVGAALGAFASRYWRGAPVMSPDTPIGVFLGGLFGFALTWIIFFVMRFVHEPARLYHEQKERADKLEEQLAADAARTPKAFPEGLNVPKIWFQCPQLKSNGVIHINIDAFNGTGDDIYLGSVNGKILVSRKNNNNDESKIGVLETPYFWHLIQNHIGAFREFSFILEQKLPERLAESFLNWDAEYKYIFYFDMLNIVTQFANDPGKSARLPLWDAAVLTKNGDGISANRMAVLRADRPWNLPIQTDAG